MQSSKPAPMSGLNTMKDSISIPITINSQIREMKNRNILLAHPALSALPQIRKQSQSQSQSQ